MIKPITNCTRFLSATLIAASISACVATALPEQVSYLGDIDTPRPYDVAVSNNTAYVTSNTNGFSIMDVSNPAAPAQISQITAAQNPNINKAVDVKVRNGFAYVGGVGGLVVLDVANPAAPDEVSFTPITNIRGIELVGNLAYVLSLNDGLYIFNVANPAAPALVSLMPYSGLNFVTSANRLAIEGGYAFLKSHPTDSSNQGVEIIDISNPNNPTLAGGIQTSHSPGMLVKGNTLFLTHVNQGTLQAYDITTPATPSLAGSFADSDGIAFDKPIPFTTEGNLLYVWSKADAGDADPAGISVLDISNPANIVHKVSLFDDASMRLESARSVNKFGDKLYLPIYWDQSLEILSIQ